MTAEGDPVIGHAPWAEGPREVLQQALSLLLQTDDASRRVGFILLDNAVELMIVHYLRSPRRQGGLGLGRRAENLEGFANLLGALQSQDAPQITREEQDAISWYHRLRNQLYHDGMGITVQDDKAQDYGALSCLLFERLFGESPPLPKPYRLAPIRAFLDSLREIESILATEAQKPETPEGSPLCKRWKYRRHPDRRLTELTDELRSIAVGVRAWRITADIAKANRTALDVLKVLRAWE